MSRQTRAKKHVHKYYRRPDGLWACAGIDGCTHYMPTNMHPAPLGHASKCWECDCQIKLTTINMIDVEPKCDDCSGASSSIDLIEARILIGKTRVSELSSIERNRLKAMHNISEETLQIIQDAQEPDEVEVIEADGTVVETTRTMETFTPSIASTRVDSTEEDVDHAPDCASWIGDECDCQ